MHESVFNPPNVQQLSDCLISHVATRLTRQSYNPTFVNETSSNREHSPQKLTKFTSKAITPESCDDLAIFEGWNDSFPVDNNSKTSTQPISDDVDQHARKLDTIDLESRMESVCKIERVREQRRRAQIRYRRKKTAYELKLREEIWVLRRAIRELESDLNR